MSKKKSKVNTSMVALVLLAVGAVVLVGTGFIEMPTFQAVDDGYDDDGYDDDEPTSTLNCPSDGDTNLKINVYNELNDTGAENFDVTLYGFVDGHLTYTITDTTAPTATAVNCGEKIILKAIGTDGASGDKSQFLSVSASGGTVNLVDGNIEFTPERPEATITAWMEQHATLQCMAYDTKQRANVYDDGDSSASDYETDGVTWMSITDNATKYDESDGINLEFTCEAVETDTDYTDRELLVLIESPTATWEDPTIKLNGITLTESEASLNEDERDSYAGYEHVYIIPAETVITNKDDIKITWSQKLKSGVSTASADPEFDIAVRTQYLSTDHTEVKEGAVTDAGTPAQIIALFDMTLDVT